MRTSLLAIYSSVPPGSFSASAFALLAFSFASEGFLVFDQLVGKLPDGGIYMKVSSFDMVWCSLYPAGAIQFSIASLPSSECLCSVIESPKRSSS